MSARKDQFVQVLKSNGLSVTKTRREIFEVLDIVQPCTMHQLIAKCGSVDRASIYRTVALFEQLHIAQRIYTGWKYQIELSDIFDRHHHHATCSTCGTMQTLNENARLEKVLKQIAADHQFDISSHQVELTGMCFDCKKRSR